ncbi:MAG: peptidoglycan-binding domain-containing protein [Patescibacteria group bacterium]|mgnify:CR=1 FL=1
MSTQKSLVARKAVIGAISFVAFYGFAFAALADTASPSIKVCKVAIDAEGAVIDGSASAGSTFTLSGITPSPETSQGAPAGVFGSQTFMTPLTPDTDLFGSDSINDAICITFSDLIIGNGGYYYGEESISGTGWATPKYNDQFVTTIASFSDFYLYDGKLFDEDISNDDARNQDADGHIVLTEERPNRILVILNQLLNPPAPVTQCNDGTDNDGDELVDMNDSGCTDASDNDETNPIVTPPPSPEPEPVTPPPSSGGGGGSGNGGNGSPYMISQSIGAPASVVNTGGGQVLGESCGMYLTEYIKFGAKNNPEEVKKLQKFLNKHLGLSLAESGFYDIKTRDAVNQFQLKYSNEVLLPWVSHGLPSIKIPTGYVFKTTRRWINMLECSALNLPVPQLP